MECGGNGLAFSSDFLSCSCQVRWGWQHGIRWFALSPWSTLIHNLDLPRSIFLPVSLVKRWEVHPSNLGEICCWSGHLAPSGDVLSVPWRQQWGKGSEYSQGSNISYSLGFNPLCLCALKIRLKYLLSTSWIIWFFRRSSCFLYEFHSVFADLLFGSREP